VLCFYNYVAVAMHSLVTMQDHDVHLHLERMMSALESGLTQKVSAQDPDRALWQLQAQVCDLR
jgi:hypothetical protein